jgi:hypothetical protein
VLFPGLFFQLHEFGLVTVLPVVLQSALEITKSIERERFALLHVAYQFFDSMVRVVLSASPIFVPCGFSFHSMILF